MSFTKRHSELYLLQTADNDVFKLVQYVQFACFPLANIF